MAHGEEEEDDRTIWIVFTIVFCGIILYALYGVCCTESGDARKERLKREAEEAAREEREIEQEEISLERAEMRVDRDERRKEIEAEWKLYEEQRVRERDEIRAKNVERSAQLKIENKERLAKMKIENEMRVVEREKKVAEMEAAKAQRREMVAREKREKREALEAMERCPA